MAIAPVVARLKGPATEPYAGGNAQASNLSATPAPLLKARSVGPSSLKIISQLGNEQKVEASAAAAMPAAGFDVPTTLQGSTAHFKVYYQAGFANGAAIANGLLASCENEYNYLVGIFGPTPPALPVNLIVKPGIAGAYHYGCDQVDLYCAGDDSAVPNTDFTRMLVVAEEVEVFEAASGKGWDCGASPGEGLSRVLATELYPAQLDGFLSAPTWLNTPGRPDFVTNSDPTDRNYVSIGCSTLFLNYLRYQLGYTWAEIVAATGATLEGTYKNLTGTTGAIAPFKNLLARFLPEGVPVQITTDNPFPLVGAIKPVSGVQFRTTLPPHASQRWFTQNWPALWDVLWKVVPTTPGSTIDPVQWSVAVQKGARGNVTYWLTIANVTGAPVECEARYTVHTA